MMSLTMKCDGDHHCNDENEDLSNLGRHWKKSTGDYCGDDDAIDNDSDISLIVAGGLWQCRHHRLPVQKTLSARSVVAVTKAQGLLNMICLYLYFYLHTHLLTHPPIHPLIHTHTHSRTRTCICVCMYARDSVCVYV